MHNELCNVLLYNIMTSLQDVIDSLCSLLYNKSQQIEVSGVRANGAG